MGNIELKKTLTQLPLFRMHNLHWKACLCFSGTITAKKTSEFRLSRKLQYMWTLDKEAVEQKQN